MLVLVGPTFFVVKLLSTMIWRFLKMVVPPNHPKLDQFSIETYGDLGPQIAGVSAPGGAYHQATDAGSG